MSRRDRCNRRQLETFKSASTPTIYTKNWRCQIKSPIFQRLLLSDSSVIVHCNDPATTKLWRTPKRKRPPCGGPESRASLYGFCFEIVRQPISAILEFRLQIGDLKLKWLQLLERFSSLKDLSQLGSLPTQSFQSLFFRCEKWGHLLQYGHCNPFCKSSAIIRDWNIQSSLITTIYTKNWPCQIKRTIFQRLLLSAK